MSEPALALEQVTRAFEDAGSRLEVLKGVDLHIGAGEIIALVGPSGSGKSTLLHIAGLLERADGGRVMINGVDATDANDTERTRLRREHLGFVYQFHHLLPEFTAAENIALPLMIAGRARGEADARATELLELVGLAARAEHRPAQLSGGEQQRIAIARALANAPALLLADEPTGNLDPGTAEQVFQVFLDVIKGTGRAALIATHNPNLASRMDRVVTLSEGRVAPA
ncbi:MAG: lipoprotein-releasing system ATP-binding protein [Alphaproteobacteria bacterium]|jgi:lipoprotein-releasing system ATP-binding protein